MSQKTIKLGDLNLSDAELIELHTLRVHHLASVITKHFADEKPTVDDINALDNETFDFPVDDERIDEAWIFYTHQPVKNRGGSTEHKTETVSVLDEKPETLENALVAFFHENKTDSEAKAPSLKNIKAEFPNVTTQVRDRAWSRYTLEVQVASGKETNKEK